jgi:hypothetical protein
LSDGVAKEEFSFDVRQGHIMGLVAKLPDGNVPGILTEGFP